MVNNNRNESQGSYPRRGSKLMKIIGMTFAGVLLAAAFALVFGLVVKLLWNWLMPAIFGLGTISYWQAFGIVLLAKLLFGGFGHHHSANGGDRHHRFPFQKFAPRGESADRRRQTFYHEYWEQEGREAFEKFLKRRSPQRPEE